MSFQDALRHSGLLLWARVSPSIWNAQGRRVKCGI
jgi:hypothetical protein